MNPLPEMYWRPIKSAPLNEYVIVGSPKHCSVASMMFLDFFGARGRRRKRPRKAWNHSGAKWTRWMPLPPRPKS